MNLKKILTLGLLGSSVSPRPIPDLKNNGTSELASGMQDSNNQDAETPNKSLLGIPSSLEREYADAPVSNDAIDPYYAHRPQKLDVLVLSTEEKVRRKREDKVADKSYDPNFKKRFKELSSGIYDFNFNSELIDSDFKDILSSRCESRPDACEQLDDLKNRSSKAETLNLSLQSKIDHSIAGMVNESDGIRFFLDRNEITPKETALDYIEKYDRKIKDLQDYKNKLEDYRVKLNDRSPKQNLTEKLATISPKVKEDQRISSTIPPFLYIGGVFGEGSLRYNILQAQQRSSQISEASTKAPEKQISTTFAPSRRMRYGR